MKTRRESKSLNRLQRYCTSAFAAHMPAINCIFRVKLTIVNILSVCVLVFVALLLCLGLGAGSALGAITVTPSAGPNGSIDPSTPQTVNYNDTITFTVTPDNGYYISSVTGCGGSLSGNIYITSPITADCEVNATFSPLGANTYVIVFLALIAISTGVLLIKRLRWIKTI